MKKYLALALALLLMLTCAACGQEQPTATTTEAPTTAAPTTEAPSTEDTTGTAEVPEGNVSYLQLSICEENGAYVSLTAYDDGMGQAYVEYVGEVKKLADMDLSVLEGITAEFNKTGFAAMNGAEVYEDGLASASMYVTYADGSYLAANYGGTIPQEFRDAYATMEAHFQTLTATVPEYVPEPMISGNVNEEAKGALTAILTASNSGPLDMYCISEVPLDEYFNDSMGLSKSEGITAGTSCGPVMSATAFSCNIATVEDESDLTAVAEDFAANVQWNRWVCVSADRGLVAIKGNMVLCLAATEDLYQLFATAIEADDWTVVKNLTAE